MLTFFGGSKMKGFTLIELMVVVLIVAVLAAILVPLMSARLEAARWAEGKAGCGTLATAIRAMYAELGEEGIALPSDVASYLTEEDLRGRYFSIGDYAINIFDVPAGELFPIAYEISVIQPKNPTVKVKWTKTGYTLNYKGDWTED